MTEKELGAAFSLEDVLRFGALPPVVTARDDDEKADILRAYTHTYLKEEIQAEGIARNIAGFSRFLEVAAAQSGELLNFSALGQDAGLPTRTVQNYFDLLEDTLVALRLEPWLQSPRKRLAKHPKFYFFDLGVLNALNNQLDGALDRTYRGKLFEHFIVLETQRRISYAQSDIKMFFWRTNHGAEVDLLLVKKNKLLAAVEIKAKRAFSGADTSGLRALAQDHPNAPLLLVCEAAQSYQNGPIQVLPWGDYLKWLEEIVE